MTIGPIPVTFDFAKIPEGVRDVLFECAARRKVPVETLIPEAMEALADKINSGSKGRRSRATAAA